ncbi:MAG: hypothetical protein PVH68_01580 [Armatimonadota bacterium]|jgi:hypothetical protein
MRRHPIHVLCAVIAVAAVAVAIAARPGISQPPADDAGIDQAIMSLQRQLIQAWVDVADEVAANPLFLHERGEEAEQLLARAEALGRIRHELFEALTPPRRGRELPEMAGRFQFVEWAQEPMQYWVLDTATGELDRRQAPH